MSLGAALENRSHRLWVLGLVVVALAVRLGWVLYVRTVPISDYAWYDRAAWDLARGLGYLNEEGIPTAFKPVGYPAFLSAVYLVFGHSWLAGQIVNALLAAGIALLTYFVGRQMVPHAIALVAGYLVALSPGQLAYAAVLGTEPLFTALFLLLLLLVYRLTRAHGVWVWPLAILLGIMVALTALVRPVILPFLAILAAFLVVSGKSLSRSALLTLLATVAALLVLLPWSLRNYYTLGRYILVSTDGGVVFWIGNGPGATGIYRKLPPDDPLRSFESEAERDRAGFALGVRQILREPHQWLAILPRKVWHLWASDMAGVNWSTEKTQRTLWPGTRTAARLAAQAFWAVIALAALYAFLAYPLRGYWLSYPLALVPLVLLYWTLFHVMFFGDGRYHAPVFPLVAVAAALGLTHLWERCRRWWTEARASAWGRRILPWMREKQVGS